MNLTDSLSADATALMVLVIVLAALVAGLAVLVVNRQLALTTANAAARGFHDLYDNIGEGVFRSTLGGRMISANPALVRLNGYDNEAEMIEAVRDIAREWYVDPNRRTELHQILMALGRVSNFVSEVYRHK